MGINSHILPGDLVLTVAERTQLYARHPDDIEIWMGVELFDDNRDLIINLQANVSCLVLAIANAGSSGMGHAFFVMANDRSPRFGWLTNWSVRSFVTQQEPVDPMRDRWGARCMQVRW